MELHVFDPSFRYRGRVQNWINMTWTEEYRGEGKFTLTTYDTDQYAELLRQGYFFFRTDRPVAMMAVKVERNTDDNTITVCGYTTLHLLTRRIIDLPHEFVNIESGIYTMIKKDLRGLPGVVTAPVKGLTAEFKCNIEGVVLLDGVFEMLNESSYGIRANFDYANKRHVIEVYDGVDRTYDSQHGGTVFSQEFGNLKSLTVEQDDDLYKNVAYVTGSSDNDPATVYYQYVSPYAGEQANWREMLVSGENQESGESIEEWQDRQEQIAKKALQGYKSALAFEVELGSGVFGEKYDLGDKVTCKSKRYGLQFDTQIMEYQYSYKQGVEKVKVVLGDRPLDYVQSSIAKSSGSGGGMKITGGGGSSSGTPGEPGKDGKDSVGIASVVQTTTSTADNGENIITVTLTDGSSNRFSVRNGSKGSAGEKGETGAVGPRGPAGADGKDGSPGKNGVDGKDGSDGYTPVRGVDYWTAADKQEIINEVSAATGGGGSCTVLLPASGWAEQTDGSYAQTASVSGVTIKNRAIADIDMSAATKSTYAALEEAWFFVGRVYTVANGITFVCYDGTPEIDISVNVEVL